ncbi:diacylglycerol kinase family protein [Nonomuraea sp. NPDC050310]|uniref:diacylglycerol/lipid kinase family protein n=1 Tax=Nonomuraea sp. NPDC050310 TaxID=3154935 RepID=UPI0033DC5F92
MLPEAEVLVRQDGADLLGLLDQAASRGQALGVCGGDGSVNAAAGVALRHGLPLAVFPGGTLNHFARDLGADTFEAVAGAVERGEAVPVDVSAAEISGSPSRHFVNTFSIGLYPELVRIREKLERRTGKTVAAALALLRVLPRARPLELLIDGERRLVWLVFAGNGSYSPEGLVPAYRRQLDDGVLDIRVVDADLPFARTRLVAAALTGSLADSPVYLTGRVRSLRLEKLHGVPDLAIDGEVAPVGSTVELFKLVDALTVYRPAG